MRDLEKKKEYDRKYSQSKRDTLKEVTIKKVRQPKYKTDRERKDANNKRTAIWVSKNRKRKSETARKSASNIRKKLREENPQLYMWRHIKNAAQNRKLDFSIELEDIIIPTICPVFRIPLVFHEGRRQHDSPSLDRIDNDKGYIKGNVQVISDLANRFKSSMSKKQLKQLYDFVFKN